MANIKEGVAAGDELCEELREMIHDLPEKMPRGYRIEMRAGLRSEVMGWQKWVRHLQKSISKIARAG